MEEEWRIIPEHPNYKVSNLGRLMTNLSGEWRLRALKRVNKGAKHGGRIYLGFNVVVEGTLPSGYRRTKTLLIHNEVAKLFIGPRPPGMQVLHLDDNRERNMLSNLKYGTQGQNNAMAVANGKMRWIKGPDGRFIGSEST